MRLTTQMRAELETIQDIIHHTNREFLGPIIMKAMKAGGRDKNTRVFVFVRVRYFLKNLCSCSLYTCSCSFIPGRQS